MDRNFAVTIFTLLFAVTTARISLDPRPTELPVVVQSNCGDVKNLHEYTADDSGMVVVPNAMMKRSRRSDESESVSSESDSSDLDKVKKLDKDRVFKVDLTPRSDYARFHAINRRFFDQHRNPLRFDHFNHPRPYRHVRSPFVLPQSETSHKSEEILNAETDKLEAHKLHGHGHSPLTRMKFKHEHNGHHGHQRHRHVHHNGKDVPMMRKSKFVSENVKNVVDEQKEKTREREASFMKSIRKFLKHTFD